MLSLFPGRRRLSIAANSLLLALSLQTVAAGERPRLMVLTDIGGDPDDQQSMIRLMTYANEFEIEGLIATASGTPGELKQHVTKPQLIRQIVDAYGNVRDRLARHAQGYPSAQSLLDRIRSGNPRRGRDAIGAEHDTAGSRFIIQTVDKPDPRPLNITIWGGQTDLAQSLWRVREDRGSEGLRAFTDRIRVYDIGDQDKIADWLLAEFPGLFYILPRPQPGQDRREAAYRGMYLGGDESLTSRAWLDQNVRLHHGPLGALYPTRTWTAPNPHGTIKEGDTPSWFFFLPNGLNAAAHPEWGGWGGRFTAPRRRLYVQAPDTVGLETHVRTTVWRWRPAFQNEFAARMDWCVADAANHSPTAVINGDLSREILLLSAAGGETVKLDASSSTDPDGDKLAFRWWHYPEASSDPARPPVIVGATTSIAKVTLPPAETAAKVHIILEVQDAGTPPLTSFRRIVVQVGADR